MSNINKKNNFLFFIQVYLKYIKLLIKVKFQFRTDTFLLPIGVFIREMVSIILVYLLLKKFTLLNNWNLNEMFFLFSLLYISYSILVSLFSGIRDFSKLIHSGQFDAYLVKPLGIFFQIIASTADYYASIGHGTVGLILFLYTAKNIGIIWTFNNIIYYLIAIISGVLIQLSIWLLSASFSFWTVKTEEIINFLFFNTRKFAGYPISIFPVFIRNFLMFVIPFAFINYFPAQYFLRKDDLNLFWNGFIYLSPLVGFILIFVIFVFWKFSLKHYSSTGTDI